ncbi:MAG: carbon starvation protein A [Candidatus Aminicenantes bacterium]|nr:carbon starvation protein A [Candidatus Aminicenantes bacterium]
MNILFIVVGAVIIYVIAYRTYGTFLAKKVFQLNDARRTPAVEMNDDVDYIPTEPKFLMGQHFSAIAAAGPITGPILAGIMFGWVPALIWIILGSIFIGGVHDIGALIASVRHKARSITVVMRQNVSRRAWILFMIFIWITLVYVIVAFTDITASSFVGVVTLDNGQSVGGGAIASSSLLYLALPVIMGFLLRYAKLKLTWATFIFLPLVAVAIWGGRYIPLDLTAILHIQPIAAQKLWDVFILAYCFVASILPMWMLLQPRGHLGGYFLYAALITAAIGVIFGGYKVSYPAFTNLSGGAGKFWFPMFPLLFITVACGACSGFHALVASGTTSKQLKRESDAKIIGYGSMLLEGLVAVIALACVMILAKGDALTGKAPNFIYASGIGRFLELIGIPAVFGISFGLMAFTTFVYDTLDVCTRLGRYIVEELTGWRSLWGKIFATAVTAGVPLFFVTRTVLDAKGIPIPTWKAFWNVFGASNQLLAGLALIGITVWLLNTAPHRKVWIVTFVPAVWMFVMSNWALMRMVYDGWFKNGTFALTADPVPYVAVILIGLTALMAIETIRALWRKTSVSNQPAENLAGD